MAAIFDTDGNELPRPVVALHVVYCELRGECCTLQVMTAIFDTDGTSQNVPSANRMVGFGNDAGPTAPPQSFGGGSQLSAGGGYTVGGGGSSAFGGGSTAPCKSQCARVRRMALSAD
jgi:hypothetical protein